jgi:hypothetical protein
MVAREREADGGDPPGHAVVSFGSSVDVATPGGSVELALWFAKLLGQ